MSFPHNKKKHSRHLKSIGKSCVSSLVITGIFFKVINCFWVNVELNHLGVIGVCDPGETP